MPPLTPFLGPYILADARSKRVDRLSKTKEALLSLSRQLPSTLFSTIHCYPDQYYLLPLSWEGYALKTRYTYRIDLKEGPSLWSSIKNTQKSVIRKAQMEYTIKSVQNFDHFINLHEEVFARQSLPLPYSREMFKSLDNVLMNNQQRTILGAYNSEGGLDAAIYLVCDAQCCYLMATGSKTEKLSGGSMSLLIWHAIKLFSASHKYFDFEGSMIRGVESFFRSFGGVPTPYIRLTKAANKFVEGLLVSAGRL